MSVHESSSPLKSAPADAPTQLAAGADLSEEPEAGGTLFLTQRDILGWEGQRRADVRAALIHIAEHIDDCEIGAVFRLAHATRDALQPEYGHGNDCRAVLSDGRLCRETSNFTYPVPLCALHWEKFSDQCFSEILFALHSRERPTAIPNGGWLSSIKALSEVYWAINRWFVHLGIEQPNVVPPGMREEISDDLRRLLGDDWSE